MSQILQRETDSRGRQLEALFLRWGFGLLLQPTPHHSQDHNTHDELKQPLDHTTNGKGQYARSQKYGTDDPAHYPENFSLHNPTSSKSVGILAQDAKLRKE